MKFKEMTDEDIQYFTEVYKNKKLSWDERMQVLIEFTGKSERTVRKWASERLKRAERMRLCLQNMKKPRAEPSIRKRKGL